ncbi:ribosome biogenesis GTPase Der [Terriglobus roseus]|uniref:GTPase Der n=1 Tax=Terriglobus roseus TaxID=392734 RepID=A0A1H4PGS7_9BACT|nr:ribosome biogenesis GTPase Der [Terriglobus roseus]SEC06609.1 GTP-binding protein [Terriglobus roseus]
MAQEKKRLGKKHRLAQTRPHKGATPKGAKASATSVGGASPKGRKTVSAKKSAAFTKSKVRTQSPTRIKGKAVTGAQMAGAAQPAEKAPSNRPVRGSRGMGGDEGVRSRVNIASLSDPETENAFAAMLPLIEDVQRSSDSIVAPLFAICGRPNVGKSTIFNRLTGTRRSIVGDEPGITRDRIYGEVEFDGRLLRIVDTGGVVPDDEALIPSEIFRQARIALEEAEAIVQVVDGRAELTQPDIELARILLKSGKPIFLAVNKMDTEKISTDAENFRQLGFKQVFPVSGEHGLGMGDLLEALSAALPMDEVEEVEDLGDIYVEEVEETDETKRERKLRSHGEHISKETRVAIIGRPNVGKSTLLNALTGTGRAIVSPIAGTTRDAVDEVVMRNDHSFRFVDTAGIRRKGKTTLMAEKLSVIMARKHLEAADVALLVIDATEGVTGLDANIGGYAHESGRSVIIVVNKWDEVTTGRMRPDGKDDYEDGKAPADIKAYTEQVRDALKYLDYAPLLFISAKDGINVEEVFKKVQLVARERRKRVTTGQMNRFLDTVEFEKAGVPYNKRLRIYYMTQAAVAPPTFVLFTDRDVKLHFSYERFLENQIRASFKFIGSPIWFKVRARNKKKEE